MPILTNAEKAAYDAQVTNNTGTSSGTNTGDQTSIVGISGTIAQFNTAISDGSMATGGGTATGTNTGDQDISLMVESDITGVTGADVVTNMMSLTQVEYDAITTPDAATFYIIVG